MSRPQVTITLGRSGQVVKRAGTISDGIHSDHVSSSGSKRPVKERLGSNVDNPQLYGSQSRSKRQRKDDVNNGNQYFFNARVGQDDLRHKLMRKNLSRRTRSDGEEHNGVDLRAKLSRTVHTGARQRMPEQKVTSLPRRIPPTRSADDLLQMDYSLRKSYSAWTLDGLRRRSPGRIVGASRAISPARNVHELRQVPPIRPVDAPRSNSFMTKGAIDVSRPTGFMAKVPTTLEAAKPVVRLPQPSMIHKSSYTAEEPPTVAGLLQSLGLAKYSIIFQAEEVDMTALKQMGDNDLKELGIPMGPRKKILLAILSRSKHRQPREV